MQAGKEEICRLLKTARGQIDGLLKMVEEDRYCIDVSNQLLSTQAMLGTINAEILTAHLDHCVRHAFESGNTADQEQKLEEMHAVLKRLSK
ncbi:MAG: metal-sensing transcriptional repressor [Peptococcaceae bacterium]|nr:metal-sensing transcriptional repressor [Peptococcaceae bacterium]